MAATPSKPTMQDVAELAGVSRSLVSLVFQNSASVSPARRKAVLEAAEELGYRPNRIARNLARGRSMTIGVVIDDLQNPFFARAVEGIERAVTAHDYQLLLANGERNVERTGRAIDTFAELQVDALVLVGVRSSDDHVVTMADRIPTVVIARSVIADNLDSVSVDERHGCRLVVEHLHELGHRTISHIDGGAGASAEGRRQGYESAMRACGLTDHIDIVPGEFTHDGGTDAARALSERSEMPSAIFAGNDLIAAGVWAELGRTGVAVPGDVSLVGYDDASAAGIGRSTLTTVRQPVDRLGEMAGEFALARLDGADSGQHVALAPTLVERSSTGAV